jgi:hypothetical protein
MTTVLEDTIDFDVIPAAGHRSQDMLRFILHDYMIMPFRIFTIAFHNVRENDGQVPVHMNFKDGSDYVYFPVTINNIRKVCIINQYDFGVLEMDWNHFIDDPVG